MLNQRDYWGRTILDICLFPSHPAQAHRQWQNEKIFKFVTQYWSRCRPFQSKLSFIVSTAPLLLLFLSPFLSLSFFSLSVSPSVSPCLCLPFPFSLFFFFSFQVYLSLFLSFCESKPLPNHLGQTLMNASSTFFVHSVLYLFSVDVSHLAASRRREECWIPPTNCNDGRLHFHRYAWMAIYLPLSSWVL